MEAYTYKSSVTLSDTGHTGTGQIQVGAGTPSPCTSFDSTGGSGLKGGRNQGLLL